MIRSLGLAICFLLLFSSFLASSRADAVSAVQPDVTRVLPAVRQHFDLDLMMAGGAKDRMRRSRQLGESLPDLAKLTPWQNIEDLMGWVAVLALAEAAIGKAPPVSDAWLGYMLELYRSFSIREKQFQNFRAVMVVTALHPGGKEHPMVQLAAQFSTLPAYCRAQLRRISMTWPGRSKQLQAKMLAAWMTVSRREGRWPEMEKAAVALGDVAGQIESWYEQGRLEAADKRLAEIAGKGAGSAFDRARARKHLAWARKAHAQTGSASDLLRVAQAIQDLEEAWRITDLIAEKSVLAAAQPELDRIYLEALLDQHLDVHRAWAFGARAKGKPASAAFLARRIGCGIQMVMTNLYAGGGASGRNQELLKLLDQDLANYRKHNTRLTELTQVYLSFAELAGSGDNASVRGRFAGRAEAFAQSYPQDWAGLEMLGLLDQLGAGAETTAYFDRLDQYRLQQTKGRLPDDFLPLLAGAAIKKSLSENNSRAIDKILPWLQEQTEGNGQPAFALWRAHLLVVRALLAPAAEKQKQWQQAAQAYQNSIQTQASAEGGLAMEGLCDSVVSLVSLIMQGQQNAQARQMLKDVEPVCGTLPTAAALAAVMDLVQSADKDETQVALDRLRKNIAGLPSNQARLQARLWLALSLQADGEQKLAQKQFLAAGKIFQQDRSSLHPSYLAPDFRAMVSLAGAFQLGLEYDPDSPFRVGINVGMQRRMFLFPPAAVNKATLGPYLPNAAKPR